VSRTFFGGQERRNLRGDVLGYVEVEKTEDEILLKKNL